MLACSHKTLISNARTYTKKQSKAIGLDFLIKELSSAQLTLPEFCYQLDEYLEDGHIDDRNDEGQTLFSIATQNAQLDIMQLLFEKRANINAEDNESRSPLYIAAFLGSTLSQDPNIAEFLIQHNANIERAIRMLLSKLCDSWKLSLQHPVIRLASMVKTLNMPITATVINLLKEAIEKSELQHKTALNHWLDDLIGHPQHNTILTPVPLPKPEATPTAAPLATATVYVDNTARNTQSIQRSSSLCDFSALTNALNAVYVRRRLSL